MSKINPIRILTYACEPQNILIKADYPPGARRLKVNLYVDSKLVLEGEYRINFPDKEEIFHKRVKTFCVGLSTFTEKELEEYIMDDRYMGALYAFRHLNNVRTKTGKLIWSRNS